MSDLIEPVKLPNFTNITDLAIFANIAEPAIFDTLKTLLTSLN